MERLLGREFNDRLARQPVGYLPIGTLERHGDHLPMGLDVIKAHAFCVFLAERIGGIVWPPHHYLGIHQEGDRRTTQWSEWGNVYISETLARETLRQLLDRAEELGFKVMVVFSGHYPTCQRNMLDWLEDQTWPRLKVLAYDDCEIMGDGDHAGIWETSILTAFRPDLVRMDRIHAVNRRDHHWDEAHDPAKADPALGRQAIDKVFRRIARDVQKALQPSEKRPRHPARSARKR